jgi:(1->4)-alpha-D-glucan 1-alpha-D-glucosylmutase
MSRRLDATYRLQLGPELDFRGARELVPYLRDLGVSHLYLSPCLEARHGSTHGYDVVDPTRISEALGGERAFRELAGAGLGVVLDIVPNHMAAEDENPFWADPDLRARFFDLDSRTGLHRRFFDIGGLAGVRIEDEGVFETTHALVLSLVAAGLVDGLRIDHVDGLADPAGYLERLRRAGVEQVWVEKIVEAGEAVREWPVAGTTGYDFLNDALGLFVDPAGEAPLTELYAELTGERRPFAEVAFEAKLEQAAGTFEPELRRLHRELDVPNLPLALASFPIYRTYVEPWNDVVHDADREAIARAALSDRLERILLLEERGHDDFVTRFQQSTGPVMAKGVEDTAFYRYLRLVALNEVGGDPGRFGLSVDEFHARTLERAGRFPRALLATQTHDTKRSADVRARIAALAGLAPEWAERARGWRVLEDPAEDYLLWQTLVGAWPLERERLEAYLVKALREAKLSTSWVEPDAAHEQRVLDAIGRLYASLPEDFEPFAKRVAEHGRRISLGMLLLKLTVPGVPDLYQGDELEDLSLVDPDNRRPVDWERRRRLLERLRRGAAPTAETAKLTTIVRALELRARRPDAFDGPYTPVEAGPEACAFLRGQDVLAVVPLRVEPGDAGFDLPPALAGRWRDVLTGVELKLAGRTRVAELVSGFPVSLLERLPAGAGRGHTVAMTAGGWTPEGWEERASGPPLERLPRLEDLPPAEHGYDRAAVQQAFEAFYRHAAQLDSTLRMLESMEVFARQAKDLRADIRALRASAWGPVPAPRPSWSAGSGERTYSRAGSGAPETLPRLVVEAAFIILVAIGAGIAELSAPLIVLLVLGAFLLVAAFELVTSTRRARLKPPEQPPVRDGAPVQAEQPPAEPEALPPGSDASAAVAEPTMIEPAPDLVEAPADDPEPAPRAVAAVDDPWEEGGAVVQLEPESADDADADRERDIAAEAGEDTVDDPGLQELSEPGPARFRRRRR